MRAILKEMNQPTQGNQPMSGSYQQGLSSTQGGLTQGLTQELGPIQGGSYQQGLSSTQGGFTQGLTQELGPIQGGSQGLSGNQGEWSQGGSYQQGLSSTQGGWSQGITQGLTSTVTRITRPTVVEQQERPVIHRPAIVQEQVHRKVVEEIQPVLYREVVQPVVIEHIRPIHETIQEPVRVIQEQTPMRDLGIRSLQQQQYVTRTMPMEQMSYGGQSIGLQGLPPRMMSPSSQLMGRGQQFGQTGMPGNIVKVDYEVKGWGNQMDQEPFVERTVFKEVPLSSLGGQGMGYGTGYGMGTAERYGREAMGYGGEGQWSGQQGGGFVREILPVGSGGMGYGGQGMSYGGQGMGYGGYGGQGGMMSQVRGAERYGREAMGYGTGYGMGTAERYGREAMGYGGGYGREGMGYGKSAGQFTNLGQNTQGQGGFVQGGRSYSQRY